MQDIIGILSPPIIQFLDLIGPLFKNEEFAPALSLFMLLVAFLIGITAYVQSLLASRAVTRRRKAIDSVFAGLRDRSDLQIAFAKQYNTISAVMRERARGTGLERAWDEYRETIIDETETPIRNTSRPGSYFSRALPSHKSLTFWSNIAVGVGLVLTFLGVVIALRQTGETLKNAGVEETKAALQGLISITAFKFTTSVAGVAASLILRFFERSVSKRQDRSIHMLCDRLEKGMLYVSPQALAASQLTEVKRQTGQLEKFNTDLALQIGDSIAEKFQSAVQPLAASLGAIQGQMSDFQTQSMGALKEGFGQTIESAASGELKALSTTLGMLRSDLDGLSVKLQGGGASAASQIEAAGETFARAATDIRGAFADLAAKVEDMGTKLTAESDTAGQRMAERLDATLGAFDASAKQNAAAIASAIEALQTAGAAAAGSMQTSLGEAFAASGRAAQAEIDRAASGMRDVFQELVAKIDAMGTKVSAEGDTATKRMSDQLRATLSASEASAEKNAAALGAATDALHAAGASAAASLQAALSESFVASSRAAETEIRRAAEQFGAALAGSAGEIERLQIAFAAIERALGGHATSLLSAAEGSRTAATAIDGAAKGMAAASQPVLQVATAMTRTADAAAATADRFTKTSESFATASAAALAGVQAITSELAKTQVTLTATWESYRSRFQSVDEDLGKAVGLLGSAITDSGTNLADFVKKTDEAMLKVVDRLQVILDPLSEYTETLESFVAALPQTRGT